MITDKLKLLDFTTSFFSDNIDRDIDCFERIHLLTKATKQLPLIFLEFFVCGKKIVFLEIKV